MAVVAVLEALQGAVLLGLVEVLVDLVEQAVVVAGCHRPALVACIAQVEGDPHVGEVHLVHRQFVGVDQGQVDLAFIDHAQQVDHLDRVGLFILQAWILLLQLGQLVGVTAALEHHDLLAHQPLGFGGPRATIAIDDLRGHFEVRVGEFRLGRAPLAADQAGRCQYRAGRLAKGVEQFVEVVGSLDLQLDARSSANPASLFSYIRVS